MRILALCGSLRAASSNLTLLQAAALVAPEDVVVEIFDGLRDLPHFNPDREGEEIAAVTAFRTAIAESDAVLICSPEYAHGMPGALKNALDWIVGSGEFVDKPLALLSASSRSPYAHAQLTEVLTVMSGRLIAEASVMLPLLGRSLDAAGVAADADLGPALRAAMTALCDQASAMP